MNITILIDIIFGIFLIIALGFLMLQLYQSIRYFHKDARLNIENNKLPPVSILKPLKGLDDGLEENLKSFFELDYPKFEIIFGVSEADDPVIPVISKLRKQYCNIPSRLIIDGGKIGFNPKINNLVNIYNRSRFSHILISDSNIRVRKEYLQDLMSYMQISNTGLVTSTIRGSGAIRTGSIFENLHQNSFIAPSVYSIRHLIDLPIVIGKSMLFTKSVLEKIGGFNAFRNFLAEDHLIGAAVKNTGLDVHTSPLPIDNVSENWSVSQFMNRHIRWAKLRKNIHPLYYALEVLSNPIAISFVYMLLKFDWISAAVFMNVTLLKISIDFIINKHLQSDIRLWQYLLIPVKDLIIGIIWYIPYLNHTVSWRGSQFKISKNSELKPLTGGLDYAHSSY